MGDTHNPAAICQSDTISIRKAIRVSDLLKKATSSDTTTHVAIEKSSLYDCAINFVPGTSEEVSVKIKGLLSAGINSFLSLDKLTLEGTGKPKPYTCKKTPDGKVILFLPPINKEDRCSALLSSIVLSMSDSIIYGQSETDLDISNLEDDTASQDLVSGLIDFVISTPKLISISSGTIQQKVLHACWFMAANKLCNDTKARGFIQPLVLQSKPIAGQGASEYLSSKFDTWKKAHPLQTNFIDTLWVLIKLYIEGRCLETKECLLSKHIRFSEVKKSAGLLKRVTVKKKKGINQTVLNEISIPNPASHAWLTSKEKGNVSKLMNGLWSKPNTLSVEWGKLSSAEQHKHFSKTVKRLTEIVTEQRRIHDIFGKRIGHRKEIIDKFLNEQNININKEAPAPKRMDTFLKTDNLSDKLSEEVKAKLSPYYLFRIGVLDKLSGLRDTVYDDPVAIHTYYKESLLLNEEKPYLNLLLNWFDTFKPARAYYSFAQAPALDISNIETSNFFSTLSEVDDDLNAPQPLNKKARVSVTPEGPSSYDVGAMEINQMDPTAEAVEVPMEH